MPFREKERGQTYSAPTPSPPVEAREIMAVELAARSGRCLTMQHDYNVVDALLDALASADLSVRPAAEAGERNRCVWIVRDIERQYRLLMEGALKQECDAAAHAYETAMVACRDLAELLADDTADPGAAAEAGDKAETTHDRWRKHVAHEEQA